MNEFELFGRKRSLFNEDLDRMSDTIKSKINGSNVLVIGAAGTIGQATTKQFFKYQPAVLHAIDISENNLVELVRDIRSSFGYNNTIFDTFVLDVGSNEFRRFILNQDRYDYILNLSALKHVRSEKDPFTLSRMIDVNIVNSVNLANLAKQMGSERYFCVSTDKAANPVNMMGASKKIMEIFLSKTEAWKKVSMARFANVAFSDGSLLHGFEQRIKKQQPITAPFDVERYFVTKSEAGQICLIATLFGNSMDIFFPKFHPTLHLTKFSDLAVRYLEKIGYEALIMGSEKEARDYTHKSDNSSWPCFFFKSDTTGEKPFEEFFTTNETKKMDVFKSLGIIPFKSDADTMLFSDFEKRLNHIRLKHPGRKSCYVELFQEILTNFRHEELGRSLNDRM